MKELLHVLVSKPKNSSPMYLYKTEMHRLRSAHYRFQPAKSWSPTNTYSKSIIETLEKGRCEIYLKIIKKTSSPERRQMELFSENVKG